MAVAVDRAVTDTSPRALVPSPGEVHERVVQRFRRVEAQERARCYLARLLAQVELKNVWRARHRAATRHPGQVPPWIARPS
jgi:hypothetical protein